MMISIAYYLCQVYLYDMYVIYRKNPKKLDSRKFAVITLKFYQHGFTIDYCH